MAALAASRGKANFKVQFAQVDKAAADFRLGSLVEGLGLQVQGMYGSVGGLRSAIVQGVGAYEKHPSRFLTRPPSQNEFVMYI